ncbi:MAG TPA: methyltransferase domain-containing protein, partial [Syntrophomonas sp.]|nr:methyltransferase domain-containing protein [Syntrophomonas sp.]
VLELYKNLMPGCDDLAVSYADIFTRNDEESISFLLKFYQATAELRHQNPRQSILFNTHDNICFPFFVEQVWDMLDEKNQAKVAARAGCDEIAAITDTFIADAELRNWFRGEIAANLGQDDLFSLNEIIALQNFSSGGESSFLKYVYPHIKKATGKVLDAGCGAGFATMVMSQFADVYSIDACQPRLERATAMSNLRRHGVQNFFSGVFKLIEDELGDLADNVHLNATAELLAGEPRQVEFTCGSIDALPYPDQFFDMINCLDVLEHTYDPARIINQFSRVLKPGGLLFITVPTKYGEVVQHYYEGLDGSMFPAMLHMHHFDPRILNDMMRQNGFKEYQLTPFDFMNWDAFVEVADKSSHARLAEELKSHPAPQVALQLFAIYERM